MRYTMLLSDNHSHRHRQRDIQTDRLTRTLKTHNTSTPTHADIVLLDKDVHTRTVCWVFLGNVFRLSQSEVLIRLSCCHFEGFRPEWCILIIIIIIIIIAFKGAIQDFLQSPHSAANCLQHARSSGLGTCNTSSAYHVQVPLGMKGQLSY